MHTCLQKVVFCVFLGSLFWSCLACVHKQSIAVVMFIVIIRKRVSHSELNATIDGFTLARLNDDKTKTNKRQRQRQREIQNRTRQRQKARQDKRQDRKKKEWSKEKLVEDKTTKDDLSRDARGGTRSHCDGGTWLYDEGLMIRGLNPEGEAKARVKARARQGKGKARHDKTRKT